MIQASFENKVQISDILDNQIPEFISSENPKFSEFLKQYYISQEIQGGNVDIVENLPFYLKLDNLTPDVLNASTSLTQDVTQDHVKGITSEIFVSSTSGFPRKYGLIQIDNEIIAYKSKTSTSFVDCIRYFSGIDSFGKNLTFTSSKIESHTSGTKVINLSVLFLNEFYSKIKHSLLTELESSELHKDLYVNNFLKNTTSLYKTKGSKESFRILFEALFNIEPKIIDLEQYVIKSSNSDFRRRRELLVELVSGNEPLNINGQQLTKTNNSDIFGSVSEIEILTRDTKTFYKILLYIGYDESSDDKNNLFTITPSTKLVENVKTTDNSKTLVVDSTIGFLESGSIFYKNNEIFYTEKTLNSFLGCYTSGNTYINLDIPKTSNVHSNDTYFAYENGDTSKKVEFRLLGSISDIILDTSNNKTHINAIDEKIFVDHFGANIENSLEIDQQDINEIVANSLIYNTSVRIELDTINYGNSTATTKSSIDKSFLRVGDKVELLKRNTEIGISNYSNLTIEGFDGQVILFNEQFDTSLLDIDQKYDIRRKLDYSSSSLVPLEYNNLTSNIINFYEEESKNFYIASNSLPSYEITKDITKSSANSVINYITLQEAYTTVKLSSPSSFINGDHVYYSYTGDSPINGLEKGEYYVTIEDKVNIKLYKSRSSITVNNFVYLYRGLKNSDESGNALPISLPSGTHTFTLFSHKTSNGKISSAKLFKKVVSNPSLSEIGEEITSESIGILANGVEILSPKTTDKIYYGPIDKIDIISEGSGYDVLNPPSLKLESGDAKIQPVVSGSIEKVYVDPIEFEVRDPVITIKGGNGKNAKLSGTLKPKSREVFFNARRINDGGGLSVDDETITFLSDHNFYNGQKVFYDVNNINNPKIGISTYGGVNIQSGYLNNNTPFYVTVINPKTVRLYPTLNDYRTGINTIGFSLEGNYGIHKFKTEPKNTLDSVVVENPGEGFENRKLIVKTSGISTFNDCINYKNHGFSTGELVSYDYQTDSISGLSKTNHYYILKINDDSFRLSNAGIGGTDKTLYNREKYVSIGSTGSGYQYFSYPNIEVSINYLKTGTQQESTVNLVPVVKGKIIDAYLYEEGDSYGSTVLNIEESPKLNVLQGKEASFTPVINGGQIEKVVVNYGGYDYHSIPDLEIISKKGIGGVLRAEISGEKVVKVTVIQPGINYSHEDITIKPVFSGKGFVPIVKIRSLTVDAAYKYGVQYNNRRDPSYEFLHNNNGELQYVVSGYSDLLKNQFSENENRHSPIIGWAYDGNPIYGPFGYADPEKLTGSGIKKLVSSYKKSSLNVKNRPSNTEFIEGYFIEDYKFDNSGDLDIHNGRWCKTPEYPNGVYAYFTTSVLNANNENVGFFPYFIGNKFRSKVIKENIDGSLSHTFNFKDSSLLRNTFPYKVQSEYGSYDFFPSNRSKNKHITKITSISKGSIDLFNIVERGDRYKVNDLLNFKTDSSNGFGLSMKVKSIEGGKIDSVVNTYKKYTDCKLLPYSDTQTLFRILPSHDIKNNTPISITGLSTDFQSLNGDYTAIVETFNTVLDENIPQYSSESPSGTHHDDVTGIVTDIKLQDYPSFVSIGSSIKVKSKGLLGNPNDQYFTIYNYFRDEKIIRCKKTGVSGVSTATEVVEFLPNTIKIDGFVTNNTNKVNYKRYFNPKESIGVGTYPGINYPITFYVGKNEITKNVPTQTIYLPNHGFSTGESIILRKSNFPSSAIGIVTSPDGVSSLLLNGVLQENVYAINKSKDYIGIVMNVGLTTTSNGLYFTQSNGSDNYEYSFESTHQEEVGIIYQNLSTVSISTFHGLENNDSIDLEIKPQLNVGIGTSTSLSVKYIPEIKYLSLRNIGFNTETSIDLDANTISIENHLLSSGDRIYYNSENVGLNTGLYYVNKVNVDTIRLSETFKDSTSTEPKFVSIGSSGTGNQELLLIQPTISIIKNNNLVFDVSDSSLKDYKLKLFYDKELKSEFISIPTETGTSAFTLVGVGTVGVSTDASLTLEYSDNLPSILYYSLIDSLLDPVNTLESSKIITNNSQYNGTYQIKDVEDQKFNIYLKNIPERLSYGSTECFKLEYNTKSLNVEGPINDIEIISGGDYYDDLPYYSGSDSKNGNGCLIQPKSTIVGKINTKDELNSGFEYSVDNTISPTINSSQNVNIKNSNILSSITIIDGGESYPAPPNLVVVDSETNKEISRGLIVPVMSGSGLGNANIQEVEILAPVTGLPVSLVDIKAINNSNGVGIDKVVSSSSGIITCSLTTPILGFVQDPFSAGDKVFVENIETYGSSGIGFNSKDHGFAFFDVISYTTDSNPGILVIQIPKLYGDPGVAVTSQIYTFATVIDSRKYPIFKAVQEYGEFFNDEEIGVIDSVTNTEIKTGLIVEKSEKNYIKLTGRYVLEKDNIIKGLSSGVIATITEVSLINGRYKVTGSSTKEYGWISDSGKLNNNSQYIPDNDYYQNLAYTVKSEKTWDEIKTPVNSIVHPIGTKNFADTEVDSKVIGISTSGKTKDSIVESLQLFTSESRVDTIKNYDVVTDYHSTDIASRLVKFKNVKLSDYFTSETNRVLQIDDISDLFSSLDDENQKLFSVIKDLIDKKTFYKCLVQVKSTQQNINIGYDHIQFTEINLLYDEFDKVYFSEKTYSNKPKLSETNNYGNIIPVTDDTGKLNLRFYPDDPYEFDYEIKVLTENYVSYKSGNASSSFNCVDIFINQSDDINTIDEVGICTFGTSYDVLLTEAHVYDKNTNQSKYYELLSLRDGTDVTLLETNFESSNTDLSSIGLGTFGVKNESDIIKLSFYSDSLEKRTVRTKTYAFGDSSVGVGTYRFKSTRQQDQAERTAVIDTKVFNTGTSSGTSTVRLYDRDLFTTVKSLARVSVGNTISFHQIVNIHDENNSYLVEAPIVSIGDTIGQFNSSLDSNNLKLEFNRNTNYSTSDITITQLDYSLYTFLDEINLPIDLNISKYTQDFGVARYYGVNSPYRNRTKFSLKYNNIPIYAKTFDPYDSDAFNPETGIFSINDHFFSIGERLIYTPKSTFIGLGNSAIHTDANVGLSTEVYAIKINNDQFKLASSRSNALAETSISFSTYLGEGNAHQFEMYKKVEKSLITLNNLAQYPLLYTDINYTLSGNSGSSIGSTDTFFSLSGISSIYPEDIIKIDDEYMKVENIGIGTSSFGPILFFTGDVNIVEVSRGVVGSGATIHADGTSVNLYRGSYNIVNDEIHFTNPPRGNISDLAEKDERNLTRPRASFSGRTFLRKDYTTNEIFDDFSDYFDGKTKTFELRSQGISTVGFGTTSGNGILFINGIYQTPLTENITNHNFKILSGETNTNVEFSGIKDSLGVSSISESDINMNQLPRGGIIVSLGSTSGLGYAPLASSKVKLNINNKGSIVDPIFTKSSPGESVAFSTVSYDNVGGRLTIYSPQDEIYKIIQPKVNQVKLVGLDFSCDYGTKTYPVNDDVFDIVGIGTTSFSIDVGISTVLHDYVGYGTIFVWETGLSSGSGYIDPVSLVVRDAAEDYVHKFVRSSEAITNIHQYVSSNAAFKKVGSGNTISILEQSLAFTCAKDEHNTDHLYPRATDPAYNRVFGPESVTDNNIVINVGKAGSLEQFVHTYKPENSSSDNIRKGSTFYNSQPGTVYNHSTGELTIKLPSGHGLIQAGDTGSISACTYDPVVGILSVTTSSDHGLINGDYIKIPEKCLKFKCSKDNYATEHEYPRSTDPVFNKWIPVSGVTATEFNVNVGSNVLTPSGATYDPSTGVMVLSIDNHGYTDSDKISIIDESIVFTCSSDKHKSKISYPRPAYNHTFVSAADDAVTKVDGGASITPSSAVYDASTGDLQFEFAINHGLSDGDEITIDDDSLTFTCSKDNNSTEHNYPRAPYNHKFVSTLSNSIYVTSGGENNTNRTPTNVTYNAATGDLKIFVTNIDENNNRLIEENDTVGIVTNSLKFTCSKDLYTTEHTYPRTTDPKAGIPNIPVIDDGDDYFTINVGKSNTGDPASGNKLQVSNADATKFTVNVGDSKTKDPISGIATQVTAYTDNSISIGIGSIVGYGATITSTINSGGELAFTLVNGGLNYTYPILDISAPSYQNLEVTGVSRLGVGNTTEVGKNMLVDLKVGPSSGIGTILNIHKFVSASGAIKAVGSANTVGVALSAITFTCAKDEHITDHSYPRATDPALRDAERIECYSAEDAVFGAESVDGDYKFTINVGKSGDLGDYEHLFVEGSTGGIRVNNADHTASGITTYNPNTGELIIDIGSSNDHNLSVASNIPSISTCSYDANVGILTITTTSSHSLVGGHYIKIPENSLKFTCSKDDYATEHEYPRPTDPIYNKWIPITKINNDTFNINVGTGDFKIIKSGVGIGSTLFEVSSFSVARQGYSFQRGDVMKVVGLVTDKSLSQPIDEFRLFVLDTYHDNVAAWQFGELNLIDNVKEYQDGKRLVYPLYYNTELISFSRDVENPDSSNIDFNSLLVIFINGILQEPKIAYDFTGGSSFRFFTSPKPEDDVQIYFYVGTRGEDSQKFEIDETIKVGDILQIQSNNNNLSKTRKQDPRMVFDIVAADIAETNLYYGEGIDDENLKPVDWIKQKEDVIINQVVFSKVRDSLEPQIYPTSRVISDFSTADNTIYLDNAEFFNYEDDDVNIKTIDLVVVPNQDNEKTGIITALVGNDGKISSLSLVDGGFGYEYAHEILPNPGTGTSTLGNFISTENWQSRNSGVVSIDTGRLKVECTNNNDGVEVLSSYLSNLEIVKGMQYQMTVDVNSLDTINNIKFGVEPGGFTTNNISESGVYSTTWVQGDLPLTSIFVANDTNSTNTIYLNSVSILRAPSIKIANPIIGVGTNKSWYSIGIGNLGDVGIGTTAVAALTINNGIIQNTSIINAGSGYTQTNPPQVLIEPPTNNNEFLTGASVVDGLSGLIVGIGTTNGIGTALGLEFELSAFNNDITNIVVGNPIYIFDTTIGTGLTSTDDDDLNTIGISTQFLDNIYKVKTVDTGTRKIKCNIHSETTVDESDGSPNDVGIGTTGTSSSPVGKFSWGRISGFSRSSNPISFGVTAYTVSGLSTYPLIQRKGGQMGLRDTGALRKRTTS